MVKSKKILSLALALVMALGVLTMGVFAAKTTPTATFTVSASASEVANGDEVTITVKANATETFYAGPMSLPIEYDSSLFEYVADSATVTNIYGAGATKSAVKAEKGKLTVALTPSTSGAVTAPNLNGANLIVLKFKLKAIGSTGSSTVAIADDQKTAANIGGKFYCGSFDSADPKTAELTEMGQTLNRVSATISYAGAVGTPELVLTKADNGAVIRNNLCTTSGKFAGCVFGIDTLNGENIEDFVTTAVGSIEVVANADGNMSTGATILLKDAAGKVVATYVFIYFGDVNGDGSVDGSDAGDVEAHDAWLVTIDEDTAAYYSADVNGDGSIDGSDAGDIEAHDAWLVTLPSQAKMAETFNGAW